MQELKILLEDLGKEIEQYKPKTKETYKIWKNKKKQQNKDCEEKRYYNCTKITCGKHQEAKLAE